MTKNKTELETYGEEEVVDEVLAAHEAEVRSAPKKEKKESALKRLWNATVFPDMIKESKAKKARQREEKKQMARLRHEAKLEAMKELQPQLVEKLKQEELKKMTGEARKEKMQKFADAFSMKGMGGGRDIGAMMGAGSGGGMSNDDIARSLGGGRGVGQQQQNQAGMSNEDISRAMGGGPGMSNRDITGMATWQDRGQYAEEEEAPKKRRSKKKATKKRAAPRQQPPQKTEGELANERLANMLR